MTSRYIIGGTVVDERKLFEKPIGPSFETKAKTRRMFQFFDIVGMTMANKAVIAEGR